MPADESSRPAVSVLIACWGSEATIERAIRSALELRSVAMEVVVVDDGSTDRTARIVEHLASVDPRVRLTVLERNVGASEARNRGLELVRGDWLTILDADDYFAPGGLEALARAAVGSTLRAVIGQQYWTDGRTRWISEWYDNADIREPGTKRLADHPGLLYFVSPHAKLLHRSTWTGLRFEGRTMGDQAWIITALLRAGDRLAVIGDEVYVWFRAPEAAVTSITTRSRASATAAVQTAALAERAYGTVAAAVAAIEEPQRSRFLAAYIERLIRYDLGPHVTLAVQRRDPSLSDIIDSVTRFIQAMPDDLLAATSSGAWDALVPLVLRWHRLDRAARAAAGRLAAAVRASSPHGRRDATDLRIRVALQPLERLPGWLGGTLSQVAMAVAITPSLLARRQRRRPLAAAR